MTSYTYATFPSSEALRRMRQLADHQVRTGCFEFVHGGTDPDDDALGYEVVGPARATDPWGDELVFDEVCVGKQCDRSLDVAFQNVSVREAFELINERVTVPACDCDFGCNTCDPPPDDWYEQRNCIVNGPRKTGGEA